MTQTKIDMDHISVIINMCVEFEKNLRGCILEISKKVKIAKMAIEWPEFENGCFLLNQKRHGRSKSGTVNANTHVYSSNVIVVFHVKAVFEILSSFLRFSPCLR